MSAPPFAIGTRLKATPPWAVALLSGAAALAAWSAATGFGLVSDLFLPGPLDLWSGLQELWEEGYKGRSLLEHIGLSMMRVGAGFLTGAVTGTLLGLGMGFSRPLDAAAAPFIEFLRPLPQMAYLVLLIVWLGIG